MPTTYHLYPLTRAMALAAELRDTDPSWTYTVIDDPRGIGLAYILITDEDGEVVGKL